MSASPNQVPDLSHCAKCGRPFTCEPAGECWCKEEDFRLPVPAAGVTSCLCPRCLREAIEERR